MSAVANVKKDIRYSLRFTQPLLNLLGAWPISPTSSSFRKLLQRIHVHTTFLVSLLILVPGYLHMFLRVKSGRSRLKLLPPLVNGLCQLLKYAVIIYHKNRFELALREMKEDWSTATDEDRLIFRMKTKIAHVVVILTALTMYSGGFCYRTVLPLSKGRIALPNNTTVRLLPCPGYFPFVDEQLTPNYEIIFIVQVLGGFFNYTVLSGSLGMAALLCLHVASLLRMLANKMIALNNNPDLSEKIVQEKIADIVEFQTRIRRFLGNAEIITQYLCFFEIANATLIACIVGYCIIMEWENSNATAITVFLILQTACVLSIFAICYIGQHLVNESNNVRETANTMKWYRFPMKKARCLVIIINMSNQTLKLTAGKVIDISFSTFTDIMKMSMGYLNMLREVL